MVASLSPIEIGITPFSRYGYQILNISRELTGGPAGGGGSSCCYSRKNVPTEKMLLPLFRNKIRNSAPYVLQKRNRLPFPKILLKSQSFYARIRRLRAYLEFFMCCTFPIFPKLTPSPFYSNVASNPQVQSESIR